MLHTFRTRLNQLATFVAMVALTMTTVFVFALMFAVMA